MAQDTIHLVGVRVRVLGSGNLDMTLYTLDEVRSLVLNPFAVTPTDEFSQTRITNFQTQRMKLRISMDTIDEYFHIHQIIFYTKPVAVERPM